MTVAVIVAIAATSLRGRKAARARPPAPDAIADLAEILAIGAGGGMSLHFALDWALPHMDAALRIEVERILRRASLIGLRAAMAESGGECGDLMRSLARASDSGAAVVPSLEAFRVARVAHDDAVHEERLQRLPVKLTLPLALLMLPGLMLMIVAPALIEAVGRFG